jgi:KipI family sensor histidine kinase inhibitor
VGRRAVLVASAAPAALAGAVRAAGGEMGLEEAVPGAATVLVVARRREDLPALVRLLEDLPALGGPDQGREAAVEIPVRYDGPDLSAVAAATGLGVGEVVAAHAGATYRGAFSGFAPGFCYLEGLPETLRLPRRPEPRPRVPAGAVAVADRYSAVYPRQSPGGWHLLGVTSERLWDSSATPPARIRPGTTVRFVRA